MAEFGPDPFVLWIATTACGLECQPIGLSLFPLHGFEGNLDFLGGVGAGLGVERWAFVSPGPAVKQIHTPRFFTGVIVENYRDAFALDLAVDRRLAPVVPF